LKDKELAKKVPVFSVVSTVSTILSAISMKDFVCDTRKDECYIDVADGEEFLPPPQDSIGRNRQVNPPELIEKKRSGCTLGGGQFKIS